MLRRHRSRGLAVRSAKNDLPIAIEDLGRSQRTCLQESGQFKSDASSPSSFDHPADSIDASRSCNLLASKSVVRGSTNGSRGSIQQQAVCRTASEAGVGAVPEHGL